MFKEIYQNNWRSYQWKLCDQFIGFVLINVSNLSIVSLLDVMISAQQPKQIKQKKSISLFDLLLNKV